MGKRDPSDSEIESEKSSENEEEEEEEEETLNSGENVAKQGISNYEKQRLSRIAQNKARMEALGLHKMANSFMGSAQKSTQSRKTNHSKGKRKVVDEDDDYRPNDDDDDVADDPDDDDDDFEDEDFLSSKTKTSSKSSRNKAKNKGFKPKKKTLPHQHFDNGDNIDEVDDELMQAIAHSLKDSVEDTSFQEKKGNAKVQEDARRRKRKLSFNDRVKMTEDEVVLHFFQLDATGNGFLAVRDLQRVATEHDFAWTDKELAAMIHCFDSDGDAKLNLDDFRKIASRCSMIRDSEDH